ncbi:hypothetical protein [Paenibacillus ginsengihumi]|uniref:hypothetical protein n=1 Tax=Paenibacillus ginsengihumi TaxID=431596 RepID=UPI0003700FB6|nr:hypothetical protein [Paenibacillus ginsengihumi]
MNNGNEPIDLEAIKTEWMEGIKPLTRQLEFTESQALRKQIVTKFIDTTHEYYPQYCYNYGCFLWDMLKKELYDIRLIANTDFIRRRYKDLQSVYLQWDFHMLHLGREYVFEVDFNTLLANLNRFPQDLYIFDNTTSWLIIQTHEPQNANDFDNWIIVDPDGKLSK